MTCIACKQGELVPGETTVALNRGPTTIVLKSVPADVCDNCGEYYLSLAVAKRVWDVADAAVRSGAEVEIVRYAA